MAEIKAVTLRARWPGKDRWFSDGTQRGSGQLVARLSRDGVLLYFQYFQRTPGQEGKGRKRLLPLGVYDEQGVRGVSLPQARNQAADLRRLYQSGVTDIHAHREREQEERARARQEAEEASQRAEQEARRSTLRQLLDGYVAHLTRQGKQSAKDVRSIFRVHVLDAEPDTAERKAAEVGVEDWVRVIARVTTAGAGRTAGKVRSYARAAYALAIASRTDPDAPQELRTFGIEVNPLASVPARSLAKYNRARQRVLDASEMGAFLRRLDDLPEGVIKDLLLVDLALGGQRPTQLSRVMPADVDIPGSTLTIYDGKGARQQARRHVVPLVPAAVAILRRRMEGMDGGTPIFASSAGTAVHISVVSEQIREISAAMVEAKKAREVFQLSDIRRTAETMLASLRVSSDVRAHLQSHGLGGVQKRHYDFHDYQREVRAALKKWGAHLENLKAAKPG